MSRYSLLPVICVAACVILAHPVRSLRAQPVSAILLGDNNSFAKLERTDYKDPSGQSRTYVRSLQSGRFLEATENDRLVSAIYFYHVRESSPLGAATDSLLHFDAAAESVWYGWDSPNAARHNLRARVIKLTLLGLTALAYGNASRRGADLADHAILPSPSLQKGFNTARNLYYGSAALTLGAYSWIAYRAYADFGRRADGESLRIPERVEAPFTAPPPGAGQPASFAPGPEYSIAVSARFDFWDVDSQRPPTTGNGGAP